MNEGWDGWPAADGADFDESDGPVEPDDWPQYPVEGFGPAGDSGLSEFDQADQDPAGGAGAADRPIGYGDDGVDEPFEADLDSSSGAVDGTPQEGFGPAAVPVGANPDVDPYADDGSGADLRFPPRLELAQPPEPIDGYPWADPATLGTDPQPLAWDDTPPRPDPAGLAAYAGLELPAGADPWPLLAASDDPATSSLARFWAPRGGADPPNAS
ncbi:hypothetical protein GCM10027280_37630 [Micromonospora polyrhachis]|uniref:Uncharacterized protein n=1 Tax=Micromonospora polyrhachis TaxID=1282883 RepID=A0A7W7SXV5_9ACTN|nr:hypothetical protein [Micromonospora polyrhachis]MBB4962352.1 hypothetical protein [Micromonospora polyrhachis]